MNDLAIQVLAFIKAHPEWAICVIGVTAFGESFAFLSLLFPGTAILIASGTLVSEGILSPFPTVAAGIVGAVLAGEERGQRAERSHHRLPLEEEEEEARRHHHGDSDP